MFSNVLSKCLIINFYEGFCLLNDLHQSTKCFCCENYYDKNYIDIIANNNECFFQYVSINCLNCSNYCQNKHFNNSICQMNHEFKAICFCCNNEKDFFIESTTMTTTNIPTIKSNQQKLLL